MKYCEPLPRSFYARPILIVARELLGKRLVRQTPDGCIAARIVEVEAYGGSDDPASHAYKGLTKGNWVMFGKPGLAYVYFIYGNHYCLNVRAGIEGIPGAVLIRGVEIIDGLELARRNRRAKSLVELANGPGKLTRALGINKGHNGLDLVASNLLYICEQKESGNLEVLTSTRIGIKEGKEMPWRLYARDSKALSHIHRN